MTQDQMELLHRVFAVNEQIVKQNYQLMMVLTNPTIKKSSGWIDMSDQEVELIGANSLSTYQAILMAQSTLREKNNG